MKRENRLKGNGDIFPPMRPTPSSRRSTYVPKRTENPEEESKYDDLLRCVVCGFINDRRVSRCAFCEQDNWKGEYR